MATYEQAVRDNPRDVRSYIELGSLEDLRGNWQKAQELYHQALQVEPDYPAAANNLAYSMLEHGGNPGVALSLAQVAKRGLPDAPAADDTLGWVYYQQGNYNLAVGLLEEAVKKAPDRAIYHYHLGLAYKSLKDRVRAEKHLERALQIDPKFPQGNEIRQALADLGKN